MENKMNLLDEFNEVELQEFGELKAGLYNAIFTTVEKVESKKGDIMIKVVSQLENEQLHFNHFNIFNPNKAVRAIALREIKAMLTNFEMSTDFKTIDDMFDALASLIDKEFKLKVTWTRKKDEKLPNGELFDPNNEEHYWVNVSYLKGDTFAPADVVDGTTKVDPNTNAQELTLEEIKFD